MLGRYRKKKDGNLVSNYKIQVNEDVYLGGYHIGDQENLVKYLNDLTIYNNTLNIPHPYVLNDAKSWIEHIAKESRRLGFQPNWAIRHQQHGLIGGIGLVIHGETIEPEQEIGYWLAKPLRRRGIMTECINAFCIYCFRQFKKINSVSAHIFVQNEPSQATIKKANFQMTRLIDNYYKKGEQEISAYEFIRYRPKE